MLSPLESELSSDSHFLLFPNSTEHGVVLLSDLSTSEPPVLLLTFTLLPWMLSLNVGTNSCIYLLPVAMTIIHSTC